jgi:hypothetical protein
MSTDCIVKIDDKEIVTQILKLVYTAKINIKLAKEESKQMAGYCECPNCGSDDMSYYYDPNSPICECPVCKFKM